MVDLQLGGSVRQRRLHSRPPAGDGAQSQIQSDFIIIVIDYRAYSNNLTWSMTRMCMPNNQNLKKNWGSITPIDILQHSIFVNFFSLFPVTGG